MMVCKKVGILLLWLFFFVFPPRRLPFPRVSPENRGAGHRAGPRLIGLPVLQARKRHRRSEQRALLGRDEVNRARRRARLGRHEVVDVPLAVGQVVRVLLDDGAVEGDARARQVELGLGLGREGLRSGGVAAAGQGPQEVGLGFGLEVPEREDGGRHDGAGPPGDEGGECADRSDVGWAGVRGGWVAGVPCGGAGLK